jgi:hypothetical protein
MVSPACSSSRKVSQSAHLGTSMAFEIRTRGAISWVLNTPTGFPDWTRSVSSAASSRSALMIAS